MRRNFLSMIVIALPLLAACGEPAMRQTVVTGAGPDDMLKLRAGPGLGFRIIMGLPDGTALNQRSCVTENSQRWCRVSLAASPGVSGYVSADYLAPK